MAYCQVSFTFRVTTYLSRYFRRVFVYFIDGLALGGLLPLIATQGSNLIQEMPAMLSQFQDYVSQLPERYPDIVDASLVQTATDAIKSQLISI